MYKDVLRTLKIGGEATFKSASLTDNDKTMSIRRYLPKR